MQNDDSKELFEFISKSPTAFHLVNNVSMWLDVNGFKEIKETEDWKLQPGSSYYVKRNNSSVIAFRIPKDGYLGFRIAASHSDSPAFKIKENPEIKGAGFVTKLNVEKYGGMLCTPWFDRPLGIAGRIFVKSNNTIKEQLFDFEKNVCLIPNLAIHMNRNANEECDCNVQNRMLPIFALNSKGDPKSDFLRSVAEKAGYTKSDILGYDLFVYNRDRGFVWGENDEFISCPRLDDAQCAFAATKAFLSAEKNAHYITLNCIFDNEETGSLTRQGAAGTFLSDTVTRICENFGESKSIQLRKIASSFLVSCDNAHAVHPNFEEKADPVNRPVLNGGVVIKFNAAQKYCSDGYSGSKFKIICNDARVPVQVYTNRSDISGGSTLGNLSQAQMSIQSVDVGIAQWAMHSPMETAGIRDTGYMTDALKKFFESN